MSNTADLERRLALVKLGAWYCMAEEGPDELLPIETTEEVAS